MKDEKKEKAKPTKTKNLIDSCLEPLFDSLVSVSQFVIPSDVITEHSFGPATLWDTIELIGVGIQGERVGRAGSRSHGWRFAYEFLASVGVG